ncbi:hypothetical protein Droror1_Dr00015269 [Drosera rotundifolia]
MKLPPVRHIRQFLLAIVSGGTSGKHLKNMEVELNMDNKVVVSTLEFGSGVCMAIMKTFPDMTQLSFLIRRQWLRGSQKKNVISRIWVRFFWCPKMGKVLEFDEQPRGVVHAATFQSGDAKIRSSRNQIQNKLQVFEWRL